MSSTAWSRDWEGTFRVAASHKLQRLSVTFDDPNLVANAGLVLTATPVPGKSLRESVLR